MPRRQDIESIALIGSGPIVIGQACEFDYSGCQALKVLRDDGFRTIVINSNPATIMTDPGFADRTYLEPLDIQGVASVLERERPDALLPTLGGQTALNLAIALSDEGILDDLGIELIGAPVDVIRRAEDRELFRSCVEAVGLRTPNSRIITSVSELNEVSLPAVVRPPVPPGGPRGGFASAPEQPGRPGGVGRKASRVHARRPRRRLRVDPRAAGAPGGDRAQRVADQPGARRGVRPRLGRVRARGHPRLRGQRGDRLLDREPRPDGDAHRRLGDRGA